MAKLKKDAVKKTKSDVESYSKTPEADEMRKGGKEMGIMAAEVAECKEILKTFEKDPPVQITEKFNSRTIKRYYEPKFQKKIDLLKKRRFPFLSAKRITNTNALLFSTFGKCYVRRHGRKIYLPESSQKSEFIIEDGDILGAEDNSIVLNVSEDVVKQEGSTAKIVYKNLTVFPNSEVLINLKVKKFNLSLPFMDAKTVPEKIKRKSSNESIQYCVRSFELLSGLFYVNIHSSPNTPTDVTSFLEISKSYPKIEFKSGQEHIKDIFEKSIKNIGNLRNTLSPDVFEKVMSQYKMQKGKMSKNICDDIRGYIDLIDNSIVLLSSNQIVHKKVGKCTKQLTAGFFLGLDEKTLNSYTPECQPIKVTVTKDALYETKCLDNPDLRVNAILRFHGTVAKYIFSLKTKMELEKQIEKLPTSVAAKRSMDSAKEEAKNSLEVAEEIGDAELIEVAKLNLESAEMVSDPSDSSNREYLEIKLRNCIKEINSLKKNINPSFPKFALPNPRDKL